MTNCMIVCKNARARNAGLVKGVCDQCALLCFSLDADQPRLLPICLETVMRLSRLQLQSEPVNVDVCSRTCPTEGAACCKYTDWFRRTLLQCACPVHELPANPRKALQLLRFRLGCCCLRQANAGSHACHAISACAPGVSTVWGMRSTWSFSARSCSTLEISMHVCSRDATQCGLILIKISERRIFRLHCLDCNAQLVGGGQQMRPDEGESTDP